MERDVKASLDAIAEACSSIDANVRALVQTLIDAKVINVSEFTQARENAKKEKTLKLTSLYGLGSSSAGRSVERLMSGLLERATKHQD
jgi:hypothetical protein